jgi:hypothetical protein
MDVRETTNRNPQNVGSLEQHVAMHLSQLTLQAVAGLSGHKNTHFWPTKTQHTNLVVALMVDVVKGQNGMQRIRTCPAEWA